MICCPGGDASGGVRYPDHRGTVVIPDGNVARTRTQQTMKKKTPCRRAGSNLQAGLVTTVNHHADHPGFAGVLGLLAGLTMIPGRGAIARLAADMAHVSSTDRVIDVGCGPGTAVREAARRGARAIGIDPAPVMLRLAAALTRQPAGITWAEGTAEDLRQPDASATVLWCVATVHHWKDVSLGLAEARRVLTTGGRLLAIERRVRPGATGLASHGWTGQQAQSFAAQCRATGFDDVHVEQRTPGGRALWTVRAIRWPD